MNIDDYAKKAASTAVYKSLDYPFVLLAEEAGETLGKLNKFARKNKMCLNTAIACASQECESHAELRESVLLELGDVAWAFVESCRMLGIEPSTVLQMNIDKLASRQQRGVIDGTGDKR